jgi:hypothetical protein
MRLQITVEFYRGQWRAHFSDSPDIEFVAESPKDAIWGLFESSPERAIDAHSITADEPDSAFSLHFSVDGR